VRDPGQADEFFRVVDDVHDTPVAYSDAPLVFVALQFLAVCRSGIAGQQQNFPVYAAEQGIVKGVQFLLCRLLDFERVLSHEGGCALAGEFGIVRKVDPFASGAIQIRDRPRSPARLRRVS